MTWEAVDDYLREQLVTDEPAVEAPGLPPHAVSALEGKFLHLLARGRGAQRILELGTLAGYSTIWLARAAHVVTLEVDASCAAVARENVDRAGIGDRVEIVVGDAIKTLPGLSGPFDMAFVDADKQSNPHYLEHTLRLVRSGGLLVFDNVVRDGAILDPESDDPRVQGLRTFFSRLRDDPRVDGVALQTVGSKGHDGFALALVR